MRPDVALLPIVAALLVMLTGAHRAFANLGLPALRVVTALEQVARAPESSRTR